MKAWIGQTTDGIVSYELSDLPTPRLRDCELLVKVKAIGLNRVDQRPKTSNYSHTEALPVAIPGLEMSGEVVEVGADADDFIVGDRVMAMVQGGAAEFVRVHRSLAMKIPPNLSWEVACAIPVSYLTAYDAVVLKGRLPERGHLLVHAVTSGVGLASLQLGLLCGAASIGGSSTSSDKLHAAKALGLSYGISGPSTDFASVVMQQTNGHGADVVVDNIGGMILNETIRATAFEGRIIDVGRLGGTIAELDLDLLALRRASLIGVTFRTRTLQQHAAICRRFVADHGRDVAAGRLTPVIAKIFPFSDLPGAIACARGGKLFGKVVVVH